LDSAISDYEAEPPMKTSEETATENPGDDSICPGPMFVTASELSQLLRISTRTLWRLLSAHKIPEPVRLGSAVRWRMELIQDWIEQGCPAQNE
jgi:excisionase family DNA binding protein